MPGSMLRLAAIAAVLPLGACAAGERGLVSPHQPIVSGQMATVPGCPDWSDHELPMSEGQSSNYGCATAMNLAAMIADPRDLVRGRSAPAGDTDQAVRAMRAWKDMGTTAKQGIEKTTSKGN